MALDDPWLAANWPFVRASLPAAPARVVEIGCGPLGGFVPMLESAGYQAIGVDPEAPPGPSYRRVEFERCQVPGRLDAIVACTSLHHVGDLAAVLDLVAAALVPGGAVVIVEWDILDQLGARFESGPVGYGPYFFPDLAGTTEADEQAAIDGGLIQANRIRYVGRWPLPGAGCRRAVAMEDS